MTLVKERATVGDRTIELVWDKHDGWGVLVCEPDPACAFVHRDVARDWYVSQSAARRAFRRRVRREVASERA